MSSRKACASAALLRAVEQAREELDGVYAAHGITQEIDPVTGQRSHRLVAPERWTTDDARRFAQAVQRAVEHLRPQVSCGD